MTWLAVGLVLFFSLHLIPTLPPLRARLVARLGEGGYKAGFALLSLLAFAVIVHGKAGAPFVALWTPPEWGRHVTAIVMLPAFILLAAAYLPGNLKRRFPNPMLLAVKLWALAHLLANGDLASVLIFASFGVYAVYDLVSVKLRAAQAVSPPVSWFYDLLVIIAGTVAYAAVARYHETLFGMPVILAV